MPSVILRRPRRAHHIICGADALTYRLVEQLTAEYGKDVTVIVRSRRSGHAAAIARLPNVRMIEAERLDEEVFRNPRVNVAGAEALALLHQDDVGNIHAALRAQELNPNLRLVVRMFNMSLGHRIQTMFADCAVLSDAAMAAPAFVAESLNQVAPNHVRLPGRTLHVARRAEVDDPARVVCALANTATGDGPDLLPEDQERANLVLAIADGAPATLAVSRGRRLLTLIRGASYSLVSRKLRIALLVVASVVPVAAVLFSVLGDHRWHDGLYLAVLTVIGAVNPDEKLGPAEKVLQTVLTIGGLGLVPLITAAIVDALVAARLERGRSRRRYSNHMVVVGLGNVGTRVVQQLHDLGLQVVAVDAAGDARGAALVRRLGVDLITGDASHEETLRAAQVETCRAMIAVTSDDVANLEAALHARELRGDLRVVLRLFDDDFADRVEHSFGITASRSVAYLAAPAFAVAMTERKVIDTIPVGRHVLLIARITVASGSPLGRATIGSAHRPGESRVIAVIPAGSQDMLWSPIPRRRIVAGDQLVVLATRTGLGRTLARAAAPMIDIPGA